MWKKILGVTSAVSIVSLVAYDVNLRKQKENYQSFLHLDSKNLTLIPALRTQIENDHKKLAEKQRQLTSLQKIIHDTELNMKMNETHMKEITNELQSAYQGELIHKSRNIDSCRQDEKNKTQQEVDVLHASFNDRVQSLKEGLFYDTESARSKNAVEMQKELNKINDFSLVTPVLDLLK